MAKLELLKKLGYEVESEVGEWSNFRRKEEVDGYIFIHNIIINSNKLNEELYVTLLGQGIYIVKKGEQ